MSVDKKSILFVCKHNSARSQMAEGYMRKAFGDTFEVFSAGTEPSSVNEYAIKVMAEIDIDLSGHKSKNVKDFANMEIDYVVTVCDTKKETCPVFPFAKEEIHRTFEDPSGIEGSAEEKTDGFRKIRDQIKDWIDFKFGKK